MSREKDVSSQHYLFSKFPIWEWIKMERFQFISRLSQTFSVFKYLAQGYGCRAMKNSAFITQRQLSPGSVENVVLHCTHRHTVQSISIWTMVQFLFFWHWIWNEAMTHEVKVQTDTNNLRVFASVSGNLCRNYIPFNIQSFHFRGPWALRQLASRLFWLVSCIQLPP